MREHDWRKGVNGAETCARAGCTVIRYAEGGMWQKKKGGHWRRIAADAIPECKGSDATKPTPLWGNGRIYVDTTGTARTAAHGDVIQDHDIQDLAKALHTALAMEEA